MNIKLRIQQLQQQMSKPGATNVLRLGAIVIQYKLISERRRG